MWFYRLGQMKQVLILPGADETGSYIALCKFKWLCDAGKSHLWGSVWRVRSFVLDDNNVSMTGLLLFDYKVQSLIIS